MALVVNDVLGSQNPNNFTVSFHNTQISAELNANPLDYNHIGQDGDTIFVRIENNSTGCFNTTQFNLIALVHPNAPSQLASCDDDFDGFTTFDLTSVEPELFESENPNNIISYFESVEDLENDTNSIANPQQYNNLSNPQTVYIKVFNTIANCFTYVSLELDVNFPPAINANDQFELCETSSGIIDFDEVTNQLLAQTPNVIVGYYNSEGDALSQTNALDNPIRISNPK